MNRRTLFSLTVLIRIGLLALLPGCYSDGGFTSDKITSINIIDRNGMSETISSKDRLKGFQKTDFLASQPYQKVMRVFERGKNGDVRLAITSYHPNGQIKQYLEAVNNRAFGAYREWFPNGQIKVESRLIGGVADLNTQAEESWLFEGLNRAWDESGHLIAEIPYKNGELEGEAKYFHASGALWKTLPHKKNQLEGTQKIYLEDGALFQTAEYKQGVKEGSSARYWSTDQVAYQELYKKGLLIEATYFDPSGRSVAEIRGGNGKRALFGKERLQELQEFRDGIQEGLVRLFDHTGTLVRTYSVKEGERHGEEIDYFPPGEDGDMRPKLLITWNRGIIEGPVKTWYENGNLESQREMSQNKRSGLSTAWYQNGSLMLVEEYDSDKLVKGEYYRLGETIPFSKIEKGKGVATLFNSDGNFSRKVHYHEGKPLE